MWAVLLPQWIYAFGHGVHQPCGQAGAVGPFPHAAGVASALTGFMLALTGAAVALWLGQHLGATAGRSPTSPRWRDGRPDLAGGVDAGAAPRRGARMSHAPRAMVLAGPTASGKSALAMALADAVPLEIVSVDSALVYRGMDIGTAKPSAAERARVPHHLIDIVEPTEAYSAARFVADATRLIADINARGRAALLVGGTMLYVKALLDGLDALPERDAQVRAAIDAEAAAHGWPALHAELAQVDPVTAPRLQPNDAQRIQRALEVWHLTRPPAVAGPSACARSRACTLPLLSLEPRARDWLHERIAVRFRRDAARRLDRRGARAARARRPARRLAIDALRGLPPGVASARRRRSVAAVAERGIAATRQLAKRQLTWLRSMPARARGLRRRAGAGAGVGPGAPVARDPGVSASSGRCQRHGAGNALWCRPFA